MLKGILVMSCIRPCVQLFMGLALCIADKSLGRNGQQIGMLMYPDNLCTIFMSGVLDTYYSDHDAIFADIALHGYQQWVPQLTRSGLKGDLYVIFRHWLLISLLSACPTIFFFLRLGLGQRRAVVIIGRWLLPSLVDTGDICCHYWQHILVYICSSTNR